MAKHLVLVLYSTNTVLAHEFSRRYYDNVHWVTCSPYFSSASREPFEPAMAPSSTPCAIYRDLQAAIKGSDRHSSALEQKRQGVLRGVDAKLREGVIDRDQHRDLSAMAHSAERQDLKPLVYVIPWANVDSLVQQLPQSQWANPLVVEYRIERLPRSCFDIIDLADL